MLTLTQQYSLVELGCIAWPAQHVLSVATARCQIQRRRARVSTAELESTVVVTTAEAALRVRSRRVTKGAVIHVQPRETTP